MDFKNYDIDVKIETYQDKPYHKPKTLLTIEDLEQGEELDITELQLQNNADDIVEQQITLYYMNLLRGMFGEKLTPEQRLELYKI